MLRVFVSSTSIDLAEHRKAVQEAILRLGMHPIMMEHFPAMDVDAVKACKQEVLDCDLFVGIYAHRYGYIPAGYTQSITEMEYDWASAANIPRYIFVINSDFEWPPDYIDANELKAKLEVFKSRIGLERVWSEFTTPESLALAVTQSLTYGSKMKMMAPGTIIFFRKANLLWALLISSLLTIILYIIATLEVKFDTAYASYLACCGILLAFSGLILQNFRQRKRVSRNRNPLTVRPTTTPSIRLAGTPCVAFVSYKRGDWDKYVKKIVDEIEASGLKLWIDFREIKGGTDWQDAINQALIDLDKMILFVTTEALQSKHVKREYRHFLNQESKTVYPIMVEQCELPPELSAVQFYEANKISNLIRDLS